jgi:site-specific DNA-methyltransferase (adenine-specific)
MPNTFAMAPGYVRSYIKRHALVAPRVDAFAMLHRRTDQLDLPGRIVSAGRAWLHDATEEPPPWFKRQKAKLVFTSPPYLDRIMYGKYNWVRLWFLGVEPKAVDAALTATASLSRYLSFIAQFLGHVHPVVRADGWVCLVIGDVRRGDFDLNLAERIWTEVAQPQGWQLRAIVNDQLPAQHKVSRIWKTNPGRATKTDRILILTPDANKAPLPALGRVSWQPQSWN